MNIFDRVINDERLQVKLILPKKSGEEPNNDNVILGYLENPFSFQNEGNWTDSLFGREYASKTNEYLGKLGFDQQILTHLDTVQQWTGANIPNFNMSFYLIATKDTVKPTKIVNKLYQAVYPEKTSLLSVKYHWGYQPVNLAQYGNNIGTDRKPVKGTVILTIGQWFRAINLVIKSFQPEYSPTLTSDGQPYWIRLTVSLSPIRLPYYDEMQSMFIQNPFTEIQ